MLLFVFLIRYLSEGDRCLGQIVNNVKTDGGIIISMGRECGIKTDTE